MKLGILKNKNDKRIALTPNAAKKAQLLGFEISLERGAGQESFFSDTDYENVAIKDRAKILSQSEWLISTLPLSQEEYKETIDGAIVISLFQPYMDEQIALDLNKAKVTAFSMNMIPRSSIAQSMDILSSMASIAGYKAVIQAANHLPRYFPMMITAAGSIPPAKVLVLGAGVAGLQAIATAKRLGAMVEAFDTRSAAKEEVNSLGAKFVEVEGANEDKGAGGYAIEQSEDFLKRQREEVQRRAIKADIIITTAQVRGRKAPLLIPASTVEQMKKGAVIVDLASSTGGNCEWSEDEKILVKKGITIIGNSNLAASMPQDASRLFANNLINFLKTLLKDGALHLDMENPIIKSSLISQYK